VIFYRKNLDYQKYQIWCRNTVFMINGFTHSQQNQLTVKKSKTKFYRTTKIYWTHPKIKISVNIK